MDKLSANVRVLGRAKKNDDTRVCVESVDTVETWNDVSIEENAEDFLRSTKYFLPWNSSYIPPSILDANRSNFPLVPGDRKSDFQVQNGWHLFFGGTFLPPADGSPFGAYYGLARVAIAGNIGEWRADDGSSIFAYSIGNSQALSCEEQKQAHRDMQAAFKLRPLQWLVSDALLAQAPQEGCPIPVFVWGQ